MNTVIHFTSSALAIASMIFACVPSIAAETTVVTTEISVAKPVRLTGSVMTTPVIAVEGRSGKTVIAPSQFPIQLTKYTAANGISIFYASPRDDLNIRRDDLLARILIEQADGAISADKSSNFINRLVAIDGLRANTPSDSHSRAYFEHVGGIYHNYDKVAQDLESTSKLGDRQLAESYSYSIY